MNILKKTVPSIISGVFFGLVIYFVEPPKSLSEINFFTGLLFFTPLLLLLMFTFNLFLKMYLKSFLISLGLILLLVLKGAQTLNVINGIFVVALTLAIVKIIKKPIDHKFQNRIPKLSKLQKQ